MEWVGWFINGFASSNICGNTKGVVDNGNYVVVKKKHVIIFECMCYLCQTQLLVVIGKLYCKRKHDQDVQWLKLLNLH